MNYRYFSTFAGIGGFELGIESAIPDAECVGFSEIDKFAIQTYLKNFPNHKNYGDITTIDTANLPEFDLLVGGFPCQSFSIAGKRRGFEDTRGTLFFDLARILKAKNPSMFLFENVKGLLSHDSGRTFAKIIETLTELGYCVQWQVLNSKNFGVPQNRERVFIFGTRGECTRQIFPLCGENKENIIKIINPLKGKTPYGWHFEQGVYDKQGISRSIKAGGGSGNMAKIICNCNNDGVCEICCIECGHEECECEESKIKQLNKPKHSNDRVYSDKGISPTLNTMQGGNRQPFVKINKKGTPKRDQENASCLTAGGHSGGNHSDMDLFIQNPKLLNFKKNKISPAITATSYKEPPVVNGIRRLTPIECERLQGFPDNWTAGVSDSQRYKQCGNAVTVNVIAHIFSAIN